MKLLGIGTAILLSVALPANAQLTGNLTVQIDGIQGQEGSICLKLFNGARGFPNGDENAIDRTCIPLANAPEPFTYTFANVPAGSYAVAVYHDRNGDESLDRGTFGIPIEGFGFSNNAPAVASPARFQDAVFLLAGSQSIEIQMRYPELPF